MSIQNNVDLKLLGNFVVDEVYRVPQWPAPATSNSFMSYSRSVGGIGNIVKALSSRQLKIWTEGVIGDDFVNEFIISKAHKSSRPSSKALIICDLENSERTSFVNWGCGVEPFTPSYNTARWTHISYLDVAAPVDLDSIRLQTEILSADVCLSNPTNQAETLSKLKYLDYLFISDSEFYPLFAQDQIAECKCIILHKKQSTIIMKEQYERIVTNPCPIVSNLNVLGAGDIYCANFIFYQLTNKPDDYQAAIFAHEQTSLFLGRQP